MKYFVFLGNIDFANDQGTLCDVLIHRLWNRTISESREFPMQMTQNNMHNKWLEILAGK